MGVGGGRHRRSIFLVSEKRRLFRQTTGTVARVNNILGNTGKIGKVDGRSNDMVKENTVSPMVVGISM